MTSPERQLEDALVAKLRGLKYEHRADIRDRATLERNFRQKVGAFSRVDLTDTEFHQLLDEVVTHDALTGAQTLRERNSFSRDDGIRRDGLPSNRTLVNFTDCCKNTFKVVNHLRINIDCRRRYDALLLTNGITTAQIELKPLGINPCQVLEQLVYCESDPGRGSLRSHRHPLTLQRHLRTTPELGSGNAS